MTRGITRIERDAADLVRSAQTWRMVNRIDHIGAANLAERDAADLHAVLASLRSAQERVTALTAENAGLAASWEFELLRADRTADALALSQARERELVENLRASLSGARSVDGGTPA